MQRSIFPYMIGLMYEQAIDYLEWIPKAMWNDYYGPDGPNVGDKLNSMKLEYEGFKCTLPQLADTN